MWGPVEDASGIDAYAWVLEASADFAFFQPFDEGVTTDTSVEVPIICGWAYRWRVRAVDGAGNVGGFSADGTFFVAAADTTPPPPPDIIAPLEVVFDCTTSIRLEWAAVDDASGIAHYEWVVERNDDIDDEEDDVVTDITLETFVDAPVTCGQSYRWRVRAVDGLGNASDFSFDGLFFIEDAPD